MNGTSKQFRETETFNIQGFRKFSSEEVDNIAIYVDNFLKQYPGSTVAVGTDSMQHKKWTVYATIVALFYPKEDVTGKGAHLLYIKTKYKKRFDLWTRLWREIEMSVQTALYLTSEIKSLDNLEVHIDINPDEEYKSNIAFQAGMGYITSLGLNPIAKPDSWVATCAADMLVH